MVDNEEDTHDQISGMKEWIIREYYELFAHKFNNLDETNQFLENHKLSKVTWNEIYNLNNLITLKKLFS